MNLHYTEVAYDEHAYEIIVFIICFYKYPYT